MARLPHGELLELKRWNTPTIYNGWEMITNQDIAGDGFNLEPVTDFMPQMGPMVGYAVTVIFEPSNKNHRQANPQAWEDYRQYVAGIPGPKIVVLQDLDKPNCIGSFWGEVNANVHRALGCVGTITDGAIRDLDEMTSAGFKALARRLCVGHAWAWPIRWDCEIEVFGRKVQPGQLIHADKHGFLAIPPEDEKGLLEAARSLDTIETQTKIAAARSSFGFRPDEILEALRMAGRSFKEQTTQKFKREGE
jgi:regulator of RNase E activity RraA